MKTTLKFFKGFLHAWHGIGLGMEERNFMIQLLIATLVTCAGIYFKITETEWFFILVCMGLVLSLELINSAMESLSNIVRDHVGLEYHHTKWPRDLAAGAVLVASFFSAIVGLKIFLPRFF